MRIPLKTVLVTALLMTVPTVVAGQATIVLRGGLSVATLGGDNAGNVDSRAALNIGGFVKLPLPGVLGMQLGAGFAMKGAEETEQGVEIKLDVDYIEIPILLTLSPPTTGNVGFNFFIGPALGFKTGCNASFGQAGVRVSVDCDRSSV